VTYQLRYVVFRLKLPVPPVTVLPV